MLRRHHAFAVGAAAIVLVSACSAPSASDSPGLTVASGLYPLEFVATAVLGDAGTVTPLTSPGVEPHDVELSPSVVRSLAQADAVLYIEGFQPAVDAAIESTGAYGVDAADVVELHLTHHNHAEDGGDEDHGDPHGQLDPHFWLDPLLLADYAEALAEEFSALDPKNTVTFERNAADLVQALTNLDTQFALGLAACERETIVVSHEAFGYLTDSYGLEQVGVAGIDPDTEPSPQRLREIAATIKATGTTTLFTESAASATVVQALAADAGVDTAVLDPLETIAQGDNYIGVMHRNLETLRHALGCE